MKNAQNILSLVLLLLGFLSVVAYLLNFHSATFALVFWPAGVLYFVWSRLPGLNQAMHLMFGVLFMSFLFSVGEYLTDHYMGIPFVSAMVFATVLFGWYYAEMKFTPTQQA